MPADDEWPNCGACDWPRSAVGIAAQLRLTASCEHAPVPGSSARLLPESERAAPQTHSGLGLQKATLILLQAHFQVSTCVLNRELRTARHNPRQQQHYALCQIRCHICLSKIRVPALKVEIWYTRKQAAAWLEARSRKYGHSC